MSESSKRKADPTTSPPSKRPKYSKFKSTNRGNDNALASSSKIEHGSAGIWSTCVRGLEAKATGQLRDLLDQYATKLYSEAFPTGDKIIDHQPTGIVDDGDNESSDIEAAINLELKDAVSTQSRLFKTVRIDVPCVLFFKVDPPIDPVHLVHQICRDAAAGLQMKWTRHINRLTPITLTGRASLEGLSRVGKEVLAPHFHNEDSAVKTFAIRSTIRNHAVLKRQEVIEHVAGMVGKQHRVDLTNPELVILVDIYTNICGMSVVDGEYERLKRYNLNELYTIDSKPTAT